MQVIVTIKKKSNKKILKKTIYRVYGCTLKYTSIKEKKTPVCFCLLMQLGFKLIRIWLAKQSTLHLQWWTSVTAHATVSENLTNRHKWYIWISIQQKKLCAVHKRTAALHTAPISRHFVPHSVFRCIRVLKKSREPWPKVDSCGSF